MSEARQPLGIQARELLHLLQDKISLLRQTAEGLHWALIGPHEQDPEPEELKLFPDDDALDPLLPDLIDKIMDAIHVADSTQIILDQIRNEILLSKEICVPDEEQ